MSERQWHRRAVLIAAVAALVPAGTLAQGIKSVPRDHGPTSMEIVDYPNAHRPGTILIFNADQTLYRLLGDGKAERYRISVGRDGFLWTGQTTVGRKATWPGWTPPGAMRQRDPSLPEFVPPGPYNPLGARALYLFSGGQDTLYRIHGTNSAGTVGNYETSGCFRMTNADVMGLYDKVPEGTLVIVQ